MVSARSGDEEESGQTTYFTNGAKTVLINNPASGVFQTQLTGTGTGPYTLEWRNVTTNGESFDDELFTGNVVTGQQIVYTFDSTTVPILTIAQEGTQIVLSWAGSFSNFVLQCSTNLASPEAWATVTNDPVIGSNQLSVVLGQSPASQYFRLIK
jgi:hypothetical protein